MFDRLFDDAALFPPGNAPMASAVPAHRELRARAGRLTGPFVVPAARLEELVEHLGEGEPFGISLIAAPGELPAAAARVAGEPALSLSAVEVPAVADGSATREAVRVLEEHVPATVPAAVELPRTPARDAVLDVLAATRFRAKLRTGGVRAELFPSCEELAATLAACVERDVPFKCTAGLHHAVRAPDPRTGVEHHGFLNVLLAVAGLTAGGPVAVAVDQLRDTDAGGIVAALRTWPPERVAAVRSVFTSFGTCSVQEPVEDLRALGLLPAGERVPA